MSILFPLFTSLLPCYASGMSELPSFRQLTQDDCDILEKALPEPGDVDFQTKLSRQTPTGYGLYGLFLYDQLIGIGQIRRQGPNDPKAASHSSYPEIGNIYIVPGMRRRGYAHLLIKHLEAILRGENYVLVGLAVGDDNTAALSLYKKLGYHKLVSIGTKPPHGTVNRHYLQKEL